MADPSGGAKQQGTQARVTPFGKYLLLERVAGGGMAEVFRAKAANSAGFEKVMAIKRILPQMAEDRDFIEMFIDEAKITGQLSHESICRIFELGKIGDTHYIAMEFVWGKDLLAVINRFRKMRRTMPHDMVAWVGARMSEGLDHAHRSVGRDGKPLGLIHRDVSPQNVLVSYDGGVKVIDFGIAKARSRSTQTQAGVLKGKFGYMSPEQVRGLPIDHRSDVFAIGTCLWEMATCDRLFLGESDFATLERVRHATVSKIRTHVPDFPEALEKIILKALARDPIDRWQTAGELQDALTDYLRTVQPPYSGSKLAAWMKTAFAPEMNNEKERMEAYHVAASAWTATSSGSFRLPMATGGDRVTKTTGELPVQHQILHRPDDSDPFASLLAPDDEEEATLVAGNLEDFAPQTSGADVLQDNEQATQIFFSAEDLDQMVPPVQSDPPTTTMNVADLIATSPPPKPRPKATTQRGLHAVSEANAPAPHTAIRSSLPVPPAPPVPRMSAPAAANRETSPGGEGRFPRPSETPPPPAPVAARSTADATHKTRSVTEADAPPPAPQLNAQAFASSSVQTAPHVAAKRVLSTRRKLWFALLALLGVATVLTAIVVVRRVLSGRSHGIISVSTRPAVPAAHVFVDGVDRGVAPVRVEPVAPGEHTVQITADGYSPYERRFEVHANQVAVLPAELVASAPPAPATPAVQPTRTPTALPPTPTTLPPEGVPGTTNTVSGTTTTPSTPTQLPSSNQRVTTPSTTATPATNTVPGARTTVPGTRTTTNTTPGATRNSGTRTTAPAATAQTEPAERVSALTISTRPWAHVFIDGRDTGRNTPIRDLPVNPGQHTIRFVTGDNRTIEATVTVPEGETVRVIREL